MAKYYGMIGYATFENSVPGVTEENFVERPYYGDVLQNYRRLQDSRNVNDDVTLTMRISIVADPYAYENFHNIRYATYMGVKWKVNTIEVANPRIVLNLGGVYNGETGPEHVAL